MMTQAFKSLSDRFWCQMDKYTSKRLQRLREALGRFRRHFKRGRAVLPLTILAN